MVVSVPERSSLTTDVVSSSVMYGLDEFRSTYGKSVASLTPTAAVWT